MYKLECQCTFRRRFCMKKKKEWYLRDPTGIVLSNKILISLAIWKFTTCLPVTEIILPAWPGYWQDLGARQNLPSRCLCLGQIVILATCSFDKPRTPALAKMSSFSLTLLHLDKWQLVRYNVISSISLHKPTGTTLRLYDLAEKTTRWNSRISHFAQLIWSTAISVTRLYLKLAPVAF